jgi:hypothetical protein
VRGQRSWPTLASDDHEQRRQAARIGEVFPDWLVIWGAYSREFWAYPRFGVPRGTIAHSADQSDLAAQMRSVQAAALEAFR